MRQEDGQLMFAEVAEMDEAARAAEYQAFVDKFKRKKTTDDCYTPPGVMEAVNNWVASEFGIDPARFVRPFYPGGDYQNAEYPDGCAVVDNPPFSILKQITAWYCERDIPFFLFAPALTCMGQLNGFIDKVTVILCGVKVTYENGANVNTSFITNMDRENVVRCEPALRQAVQDAADAYVKGLTRTLPKYSYPANVVYGADYLLAKYGQDFRVKRADAVFIRKLDSQGDKEIFGGGLLISEKAAAEKAAAEKAAAEKAAAEKAAATVWELSEREKEIVRGLGQSVRRWLSE